MNKSTISSLILLIVVAAIYRSIPDRPMGFAPQIAMALFGGAVIKDRKWAFIFPVLSIFLSDVLYHFLYIAGLSDMPGFYEGQWQNYLLFAALVFTGFMIKKINVINVVAGSLLATVVYFLTSNFVVWAGWQGTRGLGRPKTLDGLMMCYIDGVPFFRMSIIATLIFSTILFGGYYLINRKSVQLKAA
jgi:hypothetical protein